LGNNLGKIPRIFYSKELFFGSSLFRPSYVRNGELCALCNVTKKYFVTVFFISLRYVIRYFTIFNFSLRCRVMLHKFFVTLRIFRYVTFRVQIPVCWYLLHGLTNSRSLNGLQLFSDLSHQALTFFG
jgi:hypothetical protein